jgi:hypothetical protein
MRRCRRGLAEAPGSPPLVRQTVSGSGSCSTAIRPARVASARVSDGTMGVVEASSAQRSPAAVICETIATVSRRSLGQRTAMTENQTTAHVAPARPRSRRCCRTSRVRERGDASRPSASSSRARPARRVQSETAPKSPRPAGNPPVPTPFAAELARPDDRRNRRSGCPAHRVRALLVGAAVALGGGGVVRPRLGRRARCDREGGDAVQ